MLWSVRSLPAVITRQHVFRIVYSQVSHALLALPEPALPGHNALWLLRAVMAGTAL